MGGGAHRPHGDHALGEEDAIQVVDLVLQELAHVRREVGHSLRLKVHIPMLDDHLPVAAHLHQVGFGGTFSVVEEPVSAKMGYDKVKDHKSAGAEYIVSADSSCLMHQKGCAERLGVDLKFSHIAQILNGDRA